MTRSLIAVIKALMFILWSLLVAPLQFVFLLFNRGPAAYILPHIWQRGVCRILGLRVVVEGTPDTARQVMFVSNHLSYLDIPVIASVLKASFIAKKDVSSWPVFGFLSTLQQTAFISRDRKDAKVEKNNLSSMIAAGKSLILFPEGTSTDGCDVVKFKSSLFSLAADPTTGAFLPVQPISLIMDRVDGRVPADGPNDVRDVYAWHGDMTMGPHLWNFVKSRGATIRLIFHPVLDPQVYNDRKLLAEAAWNQVRGGVAGPSLSAPATASTLAAAAIGG